MVEKGIIMTQKVDRRVRKTKAALRAGLIKLMQEKSIREITVRELVDEVDINRSTFYLHYTDIYDMLNKIEEKSLYVVDAAFWLLVPLFHYLHFFII